MGGVALSRTVNNAATLARIGRLVEGQEQAIRVIVANWSRAETTNFQRAEAAFKVLQLLYRVGQIDGILRVILGNLTLMDKILYASLALSEIAALVATDGGAMVVIVGLQFATNAAFMAVDASQVNQACAPTP